MWLQAMQCPGPGATSPRRACLAAGPRRPDSTGAALTVQEAGDTAGLTLAWDEYQPGSRDGSPRQLPSATVSTEDLLFTASYPNTTSTALHGLDSLLSAIPCSQLAFNASPIQEVEDSRLLGTSVSSLQPNTSTQADELEGNSSSRFGHVSDMM